MTQLEMRINAAIVCRQSAVCVVLTIDNYRLLWEDWGDQSHDAQISLMGVRILPMKENTHRSANYILSFDFDGNPCIEAFQ